MLLFEFIVNILVTSSSSYVGLFVTRQLLEDGHRVVGTYRTYTSNLNALAQQYPTLTLYCIDFTKAFEDFSFDLSFDLIINSTGAFITKNVSFEDVLYANHLSALFISRLIESADNTPFLVINYSSLSVYGDLRISKIDDTTKPSPCTTYGTTKLLSEQILDSIKGIPIVHMRFPVVLGSGAHRAWLPTLLHDMSRGEQVYLSNPDSLYTTCASLTAVYQFTSYLITNPPIANSYYCPLFSLPDISIINIFSLLANAVNYPFKPSIVLSDSPCCHVYSQLSISLGYRPHSTSECVNYWLSSLNYAF